MVANDSTTRVLVLGAHPDDAEFFAGGLLCEHRARGSAIRLVSVTNGQSGHYALPSDQLVAQRRSEAAAVGALLNAEYVTWDFPDGSLQPSLAVREAIIREMRSFCPDLVLTHRPFDYHPDHRAVGQAVQDASYMVMVPKIAPGCPTPTVEPVVAYMVDLFTRPTPFRADAVLDASGHVDRVVEMLACHASQFFEWIPWIERNEDSLPRTEGWTPLERESTLRQWLANWYLGKTDARTDRFWDAAWGVRPKLIEAFEISEYAGRPSPERLDRLFPGCRYPSGSDRG